MIFSLGLLLFCCFQGGYFSWSEKKKKRCARVRKYTHTRTGESMNKGRRRKREVRRACGIDERASRVQCWFLLFFYWFNRWVFFFRCLFFSEARSAGSEFPSRCEGCVSPARYLRRHEEQTINNTHTHTHEAYLTFLNTSTTTKTSVFFRAHIVQQVARFLSSHKSCSTSVNKQRRKWK